MVIDWLKQIVEKIKHIRIKKIYLDYVAGILSIPVLTMAIFVNWGNITHKPTASPTPSASPSPQVIVVPQNNSLAARVITPEACTKSIGPVVISSPHEGVTTADNPVCITIEYPDTSYCSVVWSYRINGGSWSDFSNSSPCLYNLPNGLVKVDVRVTSTVSPGEKTLSRSFIYSGSSVVATPTPTTTATPTPTVTPTPTSSTVASSSAH